MREFRFTAYDGENQASQSDWMPEYTAFSATTALAQYKTSLGGNYRYVVERRGSLDVSPPAPPPITPNQATSLIDVLGTVDDASLMGDIDGGTLSARLRGTNKILRDVYDQPNHRIQVDGSHVVQPVSGSVEVSNDSGSPLPISGTIAVSNQPSSLAVSNFPATQPVSGTVSVSNFPATQSVSASSLPLPTGAATATLQSTANTSLASIDTKLSGTATASAQATELTTLGNIHTRLTEIKTKTDNIDVAISTRTKPADTQIVSVSSLPTLSGTNCQPVQSAVGGISLTAAGVGYVLAAVRKKSTEAATSVRIRCYEGTIKTNDQIKFSLVLNPTIAGTITFTDVANTPYQSAVGSILNVFTGGREIDCTYASLNMNNRAIVDNMLARLITTSDVIALVGTPVLGTAAVNVTAYMAVEW